MLVDSMIDAVRQLSDEANSTDISDADILASLNRGQQKLVRIAARKYAPMFMREATISTFSGREATIPELSFALTINEVAVLQGTRYFPIYPSNLVDMAGADDTGYSSSIPTNYAIRGNKLLLYPKPANGVSIRVRYQIRPPELVESQGRITSYDSANTLLYVDALGSELTTSITNLKAFVNIVDGTTGLVKGTLQVSAIDTSAKKLTFKTASLDRSTVFGQTVGTSLPTDIDYDDYVTIANGTCIPTLTRDYSDFIIQSAVVETLVRLGVPSQEAYARYKELEDDVLLMWAGRPQARKVKASSPHWNKRTVIRG